MSDAILRHARKRLAAVEAEAEALRAFISMYDRLSFERLGGETETEASQVALVDAVQHSLAAASPTPMILDAVRQILAREGRPIRVGELERELTERGIRIGGRDPRSNLSAKLSASDDLEIIHGLGWWFRDELDEAWNTALKNKEPDAATPGSLVRPES